jgi:hypothetical protein
MANPVGSIATVQHANPTTQPATAKPAVNTPKATPQDSVNISAAGRAASQGKSRRRQQVNSERYVGGSIPRASRLSA